MHRQQIFTWILSLLLIVLGFLLSYVHANGGLLPESIKLNFLAAGQFPERVQPGKYSPSIIFNLPEDESREQGAQEGLYFPANVGKLHMDKLISGKEAMEHAQRIHGADLPLERVFIPYYSDKDEQVTVWVFEIKSASAAKEHLQKFSERMHETRENRQCGSFYLQEVEVNYLQCANINNYYYRKDNKIYWISLVTSDPTPLFLSFYEHF